MITFSERKDFDPALLVRLYDCAPWAKARTVDGITDMLSHTDLAISVWDGARLVGFGRGLTDYVYRPSIWDVIVDPEFQGQDIGTQIMERILHHPSLRRVELFWLCTRDKQAFYEKLGFSSNEQTGMVWDRNKHTPPKSASRTSGSSRRSTSSRLRRTQPGQLDLGVKVVEKPTGSLSFGAGFSSQDSLIVSGSLSQSNLFGRGYGVQLSADIGGRSDRFYLGFSDPYFLGSEWAFGSTLYLTSVEYEDFTEDRRGIDLSFGHALNEEKTARGFVGYSLRSARWTRSTT